MTIYTLHNYNNYVAGIADKTLLEKCEFVIPGEISATAVWGLLMLSLIIRNQNINKLKPLHAI